MKYLVAFIAGVFAAAYVIGWWLSATPENPPHGVGISEGEQNYIASWTVRRYDDPWYWDTTTQ